jgi:hypothetical protein
MVSSSIRRTPEMCMTVGKVSLDDWPMLQWSLGWTGSLPPRAPVRISLARPAITSLAFMLLWVPEPVCQTTRGKWSISSPAATSSAAWQIAAPSVSSSTPSFMLVRAAASFCTPRALIRAAGMRSPPMRKFCRERWVWAPQCRWAGTSMSPMGSPSVRVAVSSVIWRVSRNGGASACVQPPC